MDYNKYKDIRPYKGEEEKAALSRIAMQPKLDDISKYLFPGKDPKNFRDFILSLNGVDDFQFKVMFNAIKKIIADTAIQLTYTGIENICRDKKYLFISNHRDILLDSGIIQAILCQNDIETSQMAVGDNLITDPFIEDVARSNKMVKVIRGGNVREIYHASMLLSEYIRDCITENYSSVWIAQRNGRTKDGIDMTEQGVLKMFDMSGKSGFVKDFTELNIIPVSVSYQYESCDLLKARELYVSKRTKYVKSPGEDLNSILTGIMQFKGNIHICFNEPLTEDEIGICAELEKNERFVALANIIDRKIVGSYKLWNTNYMAYDILHDANKYADKYTSEERLSFENYCSFKLSNIEGNYEEFKDIFLSIYANCITNSENHK